MKQTRRKTKISLSFLDIGKKYKARIYADGDSADLQNHPESYKITEKMVSSTDEIELNLVAGGGAAVSFMEVK